ncbi:4273_t:CDS:2, partial [Acaulospora colombiana]
RHLKDICEGIEALLIIHNILIDFGDDAEDLEDFEGEVELLGAQQLVIVFYVLQVY